MKNQERVNELMKKRVQARLGGAEKGIDSQHKKEKFTARERIDMLLDDTVLRSMTCLLRIEQYHLA